MGRSTRADWLAEPENPEPADFPDAAVSPKVQAAVEAFERAVRQIPPSMRKTMADTSEALRKRRAAIWSIARGPHWDVFEKRGIDPETMAGRPYAEWTPDNHELLREAWDPYLDEDQRRWLTGIANQSGGFVIRRHPPPDLRLPDIPAEIRPHGKVYTGRGGHDHKRAYRKDSELLARHLRKKHGPDAAIKLGKDATLCDDGDVIGWHAHLTKYVFPASPWKLVPWEHDHAEDYADKPEKRAKHIKKWHGGDEELGLHLHWVPVKDRSKEVAKRLDMHPLARGLFPDAARVFFGIEGCLKADAILARGEAVFSVPSVTLWDAPELEAFATRYLGGKKVFIVPDADWRLNPLVRLQALLCRSELRKMGLDAYVAAPPIPPDELEEIKRKRAAGENAKPKLNGVDDFLAAGRSVDDLVVIGREPNPKLIEWAAKQAQHRVNGRRPRSDGRRRDTEMLEALTLHATDEGEVPKAVRTLGRIMDTNHENVSRAIKRLASRPGLNSDWTIRVDGSLSTREGTWRRNPYYDREGKRKTSYYYDRSRVFEDPPTITIAPELRAREMPSVHVGDL